MGNQTAVMTDCFLSFSLSSVQPWNTCLGGSGGPEGLGPCLKIMHPSRVLRWVFLKWDGGWCPALFLKHIPKRFSRLWKHCVPLHPLVKLGSGDPCQCSGKYPLVQATPPMTHIWFLAEGKKGTLEGRHRSAGLLLDFLSRSGT